MKLTSLTKFQTVDYQLRSRTPPFKVALMESISAGSGRFLTKFSPTRSLRILCPSISPLAKSMDDASAPSRGIVNPLV